jgi:type II secretory pathway pseudopilin PulG
VYSQRKIRRAYTLIELLLVLALIIAIAAIAAPALSNALRHQNLKDSADLVRSDISRARAAAMRTGEEYALVYQIGGDTFAFMRYDQTSLNSPQATSATTPRVTDFKFGNGTLATGITFRGGVSENDSRQQELLQEASNNAASNQQQILFYPDGSTQSSLIYLGSDRGELIGIQLRGMTGVSVTFDPHKVQP